ncbi:MAG: lysozyme [Kutzneria sp.]|nr:lysozyme [Kutzneria sp.]
MSATRRDRRRLRSLMLAATAAVSLITATPAIAGTADSPTGQTRTGDHPERDYAGSTIRAHEGASAGPAAVSPQVMVPGLDVSGYQPNIDWNTVYANGARFAYVKATENTTYQNPEFANQYNGSYNVGIIRGSYHFALPDRSSGATQADYFVANGGGWSRDGKTLPPMLDIEYNPYGATCYGLSQAGMQSWIQDFSNEVHARTGRYPTVYTTLDWWSTCTGNWPGLGATNPLFIARYSDSPGTLPAGWGTWTIWQYADNGTFPGDQDYFNGAYDRLQALANG